MAQRMIKLCSEQLIHKVILAILCLNYMELTDACLVKDIKGTLTKMNIEFTSNEFNAVIHFLINSKLIEQVATIITIKNRILLANFVIKNN